MSYCAGLRRRYTSNEFPNLLGVSSAFEAASIGDIIQWTGDPGHVCIYISRQWDAIRSTYTITVIHATRYIRWDGVLVSGVLEEEYRQTYFEEKNAYPRKFKNDATKPLISVKEDGRDLVHGKAYRSVKITYSATDNVSEEGGTLYKGKLP